MTWWTTVLTECCPLSLCTVTLHVHLAVSYLHGVAVWLHEQVSTDSEISVPPNSVIIPASILTS